MIYSPDNLIFHPYEWPLGDRLPLKRLMPDGSMEFATLFIENERLFIQLGNIYTPSGVKTEIQPDDVLKFRWHVD